jgi:hypothetical protein
MGRHWGFLTGIDVGADGDPYLDRLRLFETPWLSVYLHHIHRADAERDPHDHPWPFASLVLCGSYTERVRPDKARPGADILRTRPRGSLRAIGRNSAHFITRVNGPLWTLVVTGRDHGTWGFYPDGKYVNWRDYLGEDYARDFDRRKAAGRTRTP